MKGKPKRVSASVHSVILSPLQQHGITYQQITEYILWYDAAGTRRTSVSLLDKNSHSITRAPADRVELAAQEGGTDEQYHQRDPAREL